MIVFGHLDVGLSVRSRMTLRVETDLLLDDVTKDTLFTYGRAIDRLNVWLACRSFAPAIDIACEDPGQFIALIAEYLCAQVAWTFTSRTPSFWSLTGAEPEGPKGAVAHTAQGSDGCALEDVQCVEEEGTR